MLSSLCSLCELKASFGLTGPFWMNVRERMFNQSSSKICFFKKKILEDDLSMAVYQVTKYVRRPTIAFTVAPLRGQIT